ncbi:MAG TPA: hypothetical protein VNR90_01605, partial [Vicinamibacterales bacterium]|nr:hypothetical protein [Vicinamibacterales bacterium]
MQRRTLIRARGLAAFRRAVVDLAGAGSIREIRRRAIIVPTRASAELLRQTLEIAAPEGGAIVLPDLVTRDDWMARLHAALPGALPLLTRIEREVLLERAAARAAARSSLRGAPFAIRPGLVAAMLDFYDELRRRRRRVRRFASALLRELHGERGMDRGSEGLIQQTIFLAFAYLGYERAVADSGRLDEHRLRDQLLAAQPTLPYDHVVVAVADHPSDPRGLWPADFDLAGRLTALSRLDVVMTDETHDAGFRERLEEELPEIEEARAREAAVTPPVVEAPEAPAGPDDRLPIFVSRDREEELRTVARVIRQRARHREDGVVAATAIVFQRPLPYLYLARQVLSEARLPYQAFDALPLGAEPYAGLLDVVLTFARTGGTREAAIELLRSPCLIFSVDGVRLARADATALASILAERRADGDASTYPAEVDA